jgi:diguanylate cyclase (GGDEF)-like protein
MSQVWYNMSQVWVVELVCGVILACAGCVAGWWLRGRTMQSNVHAPAERKSERKIVAGQALEGLHAAAETVRSCVQQHIDCIQALRSELKENSSTQPAILTNVAQSILAANGLVQHQLGDVQRVLDCKQAEIKDCLAQSEGLFFTFAVLDKQKHVYRQVLSSLENLAAELAGDVQGHERRLQSINQDISGDRLPGVAGMNNAISQILDATADLERRVVTAEKTIESQAATVDMQAILTHTDLLTSLPNRRAFQAELSKAADGASGRRAVSTIFIVDLDHFGRVNSQYGHQGGDVILRQAASRIKQLVRGKDLVARYMGDSFGVLVSESTMHDALPVAERIRKEIESVEFSHGNKPLHITASVGIAQLRMDEPFEAAVGRADEALAAARQSGGNLCFRHDGKECYPVSAAFQARESGGSNAPTLATMWRESTEAEPTHGAARPTANKADAPILSGRSLFMANLSRRMSEWKRGGPAVSVAIVKVDQLEALIQRFGPPARGFVNQVLARLLEAATREMDERCEFEDGVFAILLPGTDEVNAVAVAERLGSQVRQCKVRIGADLWDLTASIGVVHSTTAFRVMDLMLSAESAMKRAAGQGGDVICVGEPVPEGTVDQ